MMEKLGAPQTHLGLKAMIKVARNSIFIWHFLQGLGKLTIVVCDFYRKLTKTTME